MKKVVLSVMAFAFAAVAFCQEPLEQWSQHHKKASDELGNWVRMHPRDAHAVFEWDAAHPERSQEFVNWCIVHRVEKINVFVDQHPAWKGIDVFTEEHRPAMEDFMVWCRNNPDAAKSLMAHSKGLAWAGDHLYKSSGSMEHPR